jgi:hypothetical protein
MNAYSVTVESDERGFELHIDTDEGTLIFNVHAVAEELHDQVVTVIGPWLHEMYAAKREYERGIADDPAQQEVLDRIREEADNYSEKPSDLPELQAQWADYERKRRREAGL